MLLRLARQHGAAIASVGFSAALGVEGGAIASMPIRLPSAPLSALFLFVAIIIPTTFTLDLISRRRCRSILFVRSMTYSFSCILICFIICNPAWIAQDLTVVSILAVGATLVALIYSLGVVLLNSTIRMGCRSTRQVEKRCQRCGYPLHPTPHIRRCPECGAPADARPRKLNVRNVVAVVALIMLGIPAVLGGLSFWREFRPIRSAVVMLNDSWLGDKIVFKLPLIIVDQLGGIHRFERIGSYWQIPGHNNTIIIVVYNVNAQAGEPVMQLRYGVLVRLSERARIPQDGSPLVIANLNSSQAEHTLRVGIPSSLVQAIVKAAHDNGWSAAGYKRGPDFRAPVIVPSQGHYLPGATAAPP